MVTESVISTEDGANWAPVPATSFGSDTVSVQSMASLSGRLYVGIDVKYGQDSRLYEYSPDGMNASKCRLQNSWDHDL
jgi:hypothetical protein